MDYSSSMFANFTIMIYAAAMYHTNTLTASTEAKKLHDVHMGILVFQELGTGRISIWDNLGSRASIPCEGLNLKWTQLACGLQ